MKSVLKVEKSVEHFLQYMELLFPDEEHTKELAARMVVNHLLFSNYQEMNFYIRRFFALYAEEYNIFTGYIDQKEGIINFIKLIRSKLPQDINQINPKLNAFLSDISDKLVSNIINFCKIKVYSKDHISLADILNSPQNSTMSPKTLMHIIKKLGINVIALDDYKNGKFITHQDHQKVLDAYQPRRITPKKLYAPRKEKAYHP